jgi:Lhr-like helicase
MREVARTEALIAKWKAGREKFTHRERAEFTNLLKKVDRHNPPPPDRDAVA